MECNHRRNVSLLEGGDEFFSINKVLSRHSSVGCSSRILYYRSSEGVPFKWEMQPGTPKDPPQEDVLLPLSPPPAILSLGLPKPCISIGKPKASIRSRLTFRKQSKKNQETEKVQAATGSKGSNNNIVNDLGSDKPVNSEFYSSDCEEFMVSSPRNSSSSSSSLFSFSNVQSSQSSGNESPARESTDRERYGCSPLNLTSLLALVARR